MNLRCLALGLALPLLAQTSEPGLSKEPSWTFGVGVHTAFPMGELAKAVNDHKGFGLAFQGLFHLGGGVLLRPQLEGTGFRITRYDPVAWWFNADDREVLRTYRLGVDVLVSLTGSPLRSGPYLLGGVALQNSSFDRLVQGSDGDSATASSRLSHSGVASSAGVGFQMNPHAAVEFRYYRFEYQDPAAERASERTRRTGESLLAGLVFRF